MAKRSSTTAEACPDGVSGEEDSAVGKRLLAGNDMIFTTMEGRDGSNQVRSSLYQHRSVRSGGIRLNPSSFRRSARHTGKGDEIRHLVSGAE